MHPKSLIGIAVLLAWLVPQCVRGSGEEEYGNGPVNAANYVHRPGILAVVNDTHRVYRWWINGHEQFFYRGDSIGLNSALEEFAKVEASRREIVLCPAPGKTVSFDQSKEFVFQWKLQLVGGIAGHLGRRDRGQDLWPTYPRMYVFVGGPIQLTELQLPANLSVISLSEMKARYRMGLASSSQHVRGLSCAQLAELDHFDLQSMKVIAARLGDESVWVRVNAATTLAMFGNLAVHVKPELLAARRNAGQTLVGAIERALQNIDTAEAVHPSERPSAQAMNAIEVFLKNRK